MGEPTACKATIKLARSEKTRWEKARTTQLIADALGVTLEIRCEISNARGKVPPHVSQDGMVATAIHQGGEIVDVQE